MAHFKDWIPRREHDLLDLFPNWMTLLSDAAVQAMFGWLAAACSDVLEKIEDFLRTREIYEKSNSTTNRIAKDKAKIAVISAMRKFAREYVRFNTKVDNETRSALGICIPDTTKTPVPVPQAQCIGTVSNPGVHLVGVELSGFSALSPEQRASYGVRICWGIVPQGEVTIAMATGVKHYLAKPPEIGEELGNSVFTRKKKHVFEFVGDSGNRVYFCCRFENGKGDSTPFGQIFSAIIT
jgi:hypothetical protein